MLTTVSLWYRLLVALVLLLQFSIGNQDALNTPLEENNAIASPFIENDCYDSLCRYFTAYYDSINNQTLVLVPSVVMYSNKPEDACISFLEYQGRFCGLDLDMHSISVPMPYFSHLTTRLSFSEQADKQFEISLYVHKLNDNLAKVESYIEPQGPLFGSIVVGKVFFEYYHLKKNPQQCTDLFTALGVMDVEFKSDNRHVKSIADNVIEPGSWFVQYKACETRQPSKKKRDVSAIDSYSYVEYVLKKEDINSLRRFSLQSSSDFSLSSKSCSEDQSCSVDESPVSTKDSSRKHVCFWGPGILDGQRRIWLNQMKHLNPKEFRFTYIVTRPGEKLRNGQDVDDILESYSNVEVIESPFNNGSTLYIPPELIEADGAPKQGTSEFYEYVSNRLKMVQYRVRQISPAWVRNVYYIMLNVVQPIFCDLLVFGSEREKANDILLTDMAKILGYPSISELQNLFPSPAVTPTYVIGPSEYAIDHKSVNEMIDYVKTKGDKVPKRYVISPGVDLKLFNSSGSMTAIRTPLCNGVDNCLAIGYLGRLAPEKNPGLFVMAGHMLLEKYSHLRFVVIGDGVLMQSLMSLTHRLGISESFDFVGWVKNEKLPRHLKGIDIMINPSLRAWSETFCISNIEAMSMEIPLVTFGVGGVGAYIDVPPDYVGDDNSSYSIVKNAVLVNIPRPKAIFEATEILIANSLLRESIGRHGRDTVTSNFDLKFKMEEYAELYRRASKLKGEGGVQVEKVADHFSPKKKRKN